MAAAVIAATPFAACSSGDDEPATEDAAEPATGDDSGDGSGDSGGDDGDDGGGSETGDQGSAGSGSGRPESVRDDYPVPFPAGWEIDIQGEIGMVEASGAQLLYPDGAYDDIVAFYDDWYDAQPGESARTVSGDQVFYQLLDGGDLYQVSVTPDHEERDETWVLLQVFGGPVN